MDEYKVVIGQKKSPVSLLMCQILYSALELKIAVISDNLKGSRKIFKIYLPILACFYNGKHLTVVDLIVVFGFVHGL
jgi:hypothetical protein